MPLGEQASKRVKEPGKETSKNAARIEEGHTLKAFKFNLCHRLC